MSNIKQLRIELEGFRNQQQEIFDLRPIEKWMIEKLGVVRIRRKRGCGIIYSHPLLERVQGSDRFVIHTVHKKREQIRRVNFLQYLYRRLVEIINEIEQEE